MWVEVTPSSNSPSREPYLAVLASLDSNGYWGKGGEVASGSSTRADYFENMVVRPEYRRAWNSDGTPILKAAN